MTAQRTSELLQGGRWRRVVDVCAMLGVCWAAMGAALATEPSSQAASRARAETRVTVRLLAQATTAGGPTGVPRVRVARELPVGGTATARFAAGTAVDPDLCGLRTVAAGETSDAFVSWQVSATVREVQGDAVRLSVEWVRDGLQPIGGSQTSGPSELRLRPGQTHVLDAVTAPRTSARGCANVLVSVEVGVPPSGANGAALLGYHLALVHERAGTRASPPAVDLVGPPGESLAFRFRPLEWTVSQAAERQVSPVVAMDVLGEVSGTVMDDGKVDVSLATIRRLMFGGAHEGSGAMHVMVTPGEEILVEIPRPTTTSWRAGSAGGRLGGLLPGVQAERDGLRVDYAAFFAGDRTSLVIRVDRLR